jgi:hypothetical protein
MLEKAIEMKRSEMLKLADIHGLSAIPTLRCSQELDHLLNLYNYHNTVSNTARKIS